MSDLDAPLEVGPKTAQPAQPSSPAPAFPGVQSCSSGFAALQIDCGVVDVSFDWDVRGWFDCRVKNIEEYFCKGTTRQNLIWQRTFSNYIQRTTSWITLLVNILRIDMD